MRVKQLVWISYRSIVSFQLSFCDFVLKTNLLESKSRIWSLHFKTCATVRLKMFFFQRLCSEPLALPQVAHTPAVQRRVHDQGSWQVNRQIPAIFFSIVIGRSLLLFLNLDCIFICFVWSWFLQRPAGSSQRVLLSKRRGRHRCKAPLLLKGCHHLSQSLSLHPKSLLHLLPYFLLCGSGSVTRICTWWEKKELIFWSLKNANSQMRGMNPPPPSPPQCIRICPHLIVVP